MTTKYRCSRGTIRPMPGVRIHHREKRDCVVQIPHMGRSQAGHPKVYNVRLDGQGDAIVSPTVWSRLQEALGLLGSPNIFLLLDEVNTPPTLIVGKTTGRDQRVFRMSEGVMREQTPTPEALYVPGRR
jgi:hypothetical protein